jgi:hypothetical protein
MEDKPRKVGGYGKIRPSDNTKPFTKDYNGSNFATWTEDRIHIILNELEDWLLSTTEVLDDDGEVIGEVDDGNIFYKEFLYRNKLMDDWIGYVTRKYTTVADRMEEINKIQELRLQMLAINGRTKENITKFILTNKHKWSERNENINTNTNIVWKETKNYDDDHLLD